MKTLINCLILDDEPLAVKLITGYAQKISHLKVLYAGTDVYKAIDTLNTYPVNLIFLDIQMPDLTGLELMEMFDKNHNFIITSAYQEYALDTYKFNVIDFLVKPVTFNRFYQSISKFTHWQETFGKVTPQKYLFVRADRKHYQLGIDSILYIEGLKDYIRIHTTEEKLIVLESMKNILDELPGDRFIRIHRSYIVPVERIKFIEGNRIKMENQQYLPIGETYRKKLAKWLNEKQ